MALPVPGVVPPRDDPIPASPTAAARRGPLPLRLPRTFAALRHRRYRLFFWGALAANAAMQMQQIARGYLAYELTGTATAVGLVMLSWGLPMLLVSLIGGVVADRVDRRNLLLVTQALTGLLALTLAVLVHLGVITIGHLILLGLCQGTVFAFSMPARQALVPQLVAEQDLMNALALNNAGMNFTRVFGPALAGQLIAVPLIGLTGVFYLTAALYLFYLAFVSQIPAGGGPARGPRRSMAAEFVDGLRYLRAEPALLVLLLLGFVPMLFGMPYQQMLPVIAKDVFHTGAQGLGLMATVTGIGALAGSLAIASLGSMRHQRRLQLLTGIGFGLTLIAFSLTRSLPLAMVVLVLVGGTATCYQTINSTLVMTTADRAYQGRVMSVWMMSISLMPMSALPVGMVVDRVGAPLTVGAGGAVVAAFVAAVAVGLPRLRRPAPLPVGQPGGRPSA
jgi:MFS family permease